MNWIIGFVLVAVIFGICAGLSNNDADKSSSQKALEGGATGAAVGLGCLFQIFMALMGIAFMFFVLNFAYVLIFK